MPTECDRLWKRGARVALLLQRALDERAYGFVETEQVQLSDEERADVHLVNALLDVEYAHRQHQWRALERLLSYVPPGGPYQEAAYLPVPQMRSAVDAACACGWFAVAPEPGDDA